MTDYDIEKYRQNYLSSLNDILKDKDVSVTKERTLDVYSKGNRNKGRIEITDTRKMDIDYEKPSYKNRIFPVWAKIFMAACAGLLFWSYSMGGELEENVKGLYFNGSNSGQSYQKLEAKLEGGMMIENEK